MAELFFIVAILLPGAIALAVYIMHLQQDWPGIVPGHLSDKKVMTLAFKFHC